MVEMAESRDALFVRFRYDAVLQETFKQLCGAIAQTEEHNDFQIGVELLCEEPPLIRLYIRDPDSRELCTEHFNSTTFSAIEYGAECLFGWGLVLRNTVGGAVLGQFVPMQEIGADVNDNWLNQTFGHYSEESE